MIIQKHIVHMNKEIFRELRKSIAEKDGKNFYLQVKKVLNQNKNKNITYNYGRY
ncbi:MAG: hypothetical protein KGD63_02165 [Candidatus Lokiarchaeota archaeon]|nr:hypothetical protein [Candidatus Lokiarchaeota archaeon]